MVFDIIPARPDKTINMLSLYRVAYNLIRQCVGPPGMDGGRAFYFDMGKGVKVTLRHSEPTSVNATGIDEFPESGGSAMGLRMPTVAS